MAEVDQYDGVIFFAVVWCDLKGVWIRLSIFPRMSGGMRREIISSIISGGRGYWASEKFVVKKSEFW